MRVQYSDGTALKEAVIQVWEDLHEARSGFFRAFWTAHSHATIGSPVIGYCSGGSHRTIAAVVAEVRRLGYRDSIYRNGRLIDGGAA